MSLLPHQIFISSLLFLSLLSLSFSSCEIGNYCDNNVPCSTNGNCNYDIFELYDANRTAEPQSSCFCNKGYTSFGINGNISSSDNIYCCYKQKSQTIAFLLETLIGFGLGHLYLGRYAFFAVKFAIQLIFCVVCILSTIITCVKERDLTEEEKDEFDENEDEGEKKQIFSFFKGCNVYTIMILCCVFGYSLFQIIDIMVVGFAYYKDGNGETMKMW